MWKTIKDCSGIINLSSSFLSSKLIEYDSETIQIKITENSSIELLSNPVDPIGNIFVLQGGVNHDVNDSFYIKNTCLYLTFERAPVRIYLYKNNLPIINESFLPEIDQCIKYIKKSTQQSCIMIGYSMGGVVLYSYLSRGFLAADYYLPVCCPINLAKFHQQIEENAIFRRLQQKTLRRFKVSSQEELFLLARTSKEQNQEFIETFTDHLNQTIDQWVDRLTYIYGNKDPLTLDLNQDLAQFNRKITTVIIENGWHCDLDSVIQACKIGLSYFSGEIKIIKNSKNVFN